MTIYFDDIGTESQLKLLPSASWKIIKAAYLADQIHFVHAGWNVDLIKYIWELIKLIILIPLQQVIYWRNDYQKIKCIKLKSTIWLMAGQGI